jgi:hypothetical protein
MSPQIIQENPIAHLGLLRMYPGHRTPQNLLDHGKWDENLVE